jgi:hypothetical protein
MTSGRDNRNRNPIWDLTSSRAMAVMVRFSNSSTFEKQG